MSVESEDPGLPSDPGFAPKDLTDARLPGQWRSRYEASAWKWILAEGVNLVLFLVVVVCSLVIIWLRHPAAWWQLSPQQSETFTVYAYAWLGGTLGGLLFAMKWLYHSVAKRLWHLDRALWRYLTPIISGGLAFATVAIFNSLLGSDQGPMMSGPKTIAIGFLVGFFSDNAVAKLAEVAETVLGPTRRSASSRQGQRSDSDGPTS